MKEPFVVAVTLSLVSLLHPPQRTRVVTAFSHLTRLSSGANAAQMMSQYGPVPIGNWPGFNVGDSNILLAGVAICNSFIGPQTPGLLTP